MKRKVLTSILTMLLLFMLGISTVVVNAFTIVEDDDEQAEEMEVGRAFAYGNGEIRISERGQDKISITIAKDAPNDQSMAIAFGKMGMNPDTLVEAVSGSAIIVRGIDSLLSGVEIRPNGDNTMRLHLVFKEDLTEGDYTIEIPAGYFTVRSASGSKQLYTNKAVTVNVKVVTAATAAGLIKKPEIKIVDNTVAWELVEGAFSYRVTYYEKDDEGVKVPPNGSANFQADMSGSTSYLDLYNNFPYQPGKKYIVKVSAYPTATSTLGVAETELLYKEMGEERVDAPEKSDIKFEYSSTSKANTVLKIESDNGNIEYFFRLFADDDTKPFTTYRRGRYNGYDIGSRLSREDIKDVFYVEVCAVDLSNHDLAASDWVRSDGQPLDTQENLLSNIKDNMTKEEFEAVAKNLLENGKTIDDLNELLLNSTEEKDAIREGYKTLDKAAQDKKNITISEPSVADSLKAMLDGAITTAGLALNSAENTDVALNIKEPANKVPVPAGYNASSAVHMDISVEPKLEDQKYPVMITMPIPAGLNVNKKIVIFHEGEKIYPIINKEENTLTFSVTHFSGFAFVNEEEPAPVLPTRPTYPTYRPSSSGSSSTSSAAVNALQTNSKPGVWAKNATGRWFSFTDKTYPASQWLQVSGKWYYFDESGYVSTGWKMLDGKWYYMDTENGDMAEGWKSVNGKWYFLNPADGDMAQGWKIIDGKWYYLNPENGDMAEGWKLVDGKWYYLNPVNGDMATGKTQINGKWYYLTENGDCLLNTVTPDGGKADADGVVLYSEAK